jgi:hypothetical protein
VGERIHHFSWDQTLQTTLRDSSPAGIEASVTVRIACSDRTTPARSRLSFGSKHVKPPIEFRHRGLSLSFRDLGLPRWLTVLLVLALGAILLLIAAKTGGPRVLCRVMLGL